MPLDTVDARTKRRRLPTVDVPQVADDGLRRSLEALQEHLRMYEGDSGAPKERFVTIEELELAGLIGTKVQNKYALIDSVLGSPVSQGQQGGSTTIVNSTGAQTLAGLTDTAVNGAGTDEFLKFVGGKWVNFDLFGNENVWTDRQVFDGCISIQAINNDAYVEFCHDDVNLNITGYDTTNTNLVGMDLTLDTEQAINWDTTELLFFGGGIPGDPYWNNVGLYSRLNGTDGSTASFSSDDVNAHTMVPTNGAQIDTAQSKFGGSSILLDNTGAPALADYVRLNDYVGMELLGNDFTVEAWIRLASLPTTSVDGGFTIIAHYQNSGNLRQWWFKLDDSNALEFAYSTDGITVDNVCQTSFTFAVDTWYAVAAVRDGNSVYLYVDGTRIGTHAVSGSVYGSYSAFPYIGLTNTSSGFRSQFDGWIDEIRLTVGTARYTGATYTLQTEEFPTAAGATEVFTVGDPAYNTTIDGPTTTVTGNAVVDGTLNVAGATDLGSTLNVVGATDLDSTLNVDGAADFRAGVTIHDYDIYPAGTHLTLAYTGQNEDARFIRFIEEIDNAGGAGFYIDYEGLSNSPGNELHFGCDKPSSAGTIFWIGERGQFRLEDNLDTGLSTTSTEHPLQIGPTTSDNLRFDRQGMQALINGTPNILSLNEYGGGVYLNQTGYTTTSADLRVYLGSTGRFYRYGNSANLNVFDFFSANNYQMWPGFTTERYQLVDWDGVDIMGGNFRIGDSSSMGAYYDFSITSFTGPAVLNFDSCATWSITGLTTEMFVDTDLRVSGDLTVSGTTTTINSNVVSIADNIILLNSDEAGAPTQDAGLEVERGTSPNVFFQFDETTDRWEFTNDGTTYYNLMAMADGTSTNNTLRWDGSNWVETNVLRVNAAAGQVDVTQPASTTGGYYVLSTDAPSASYMGVHNTETGQYIELAAFGSTQGTGNKPTALYWDADNSDFHITGAFGVGSETWLQFINEGPDTNKVVKVADGTRLRIEDGSETNSVDIYHDGSDLVLQKTGIASFFEVGTTDGIKVDAGTGIPGEYGVQTWSWDTDQAAWSVWFNNQSSRWLEITVAGDTYSGGSYPEHTLEFQSDVDPFVIRGIGSGNDFMRFSELSADVTDVALPDGTSLTVWDSTNVDNVRISHDGTDLVIGGTNTRNIQYKSTNSNNGGMFIWNPDQTGFQKYAVQTGDGSDWRYAEFGTTGSAGFFGKAIDSTYIYWSTTSSTPDYPNFYMFNDYGYALRIVDHLTYNSVDIISDTTNNPTRFRIYDPAGTDHVESYHDGTNFYTRGTNTGIWEISGLDSGMFVYSNAYAEIGTDVNTALNSYSSVSCYYSAVGVNAIQMGASGSTAPYYPGTNWLFSNQELQIDGAGTNFRRTTGAGGALVRFYDSTDTGYAEFNHDGADFNIDVSGTANLNMNGFTAGDPTLNLDASFKLTGNGWYIARDGDTSGMTIYGGDYTTAGTSNIELYGASHASVPGEIYYDATKHSFRGPDAAPTWLTIADTRITSNLGVRINGDISKALTGTVSVTAATAAVTGVGTVFTTECGRGCVIKIGTEVFKVASVTNNTSLTLDSNHIAGASGVTAYTDADQFLLYNGENDLAFAVDTAGSVATGIYVTAADGYTGYYQDSNQADVGSYLGVANNGTGGAGGIFTYLELKVLGEDNTDQAFYAPGHILGFEADSAPLYIGDYKQDKRFLKFELDTGVKWIDVEDGSRLRFNNDAETQSAYLIQGANDGDLNLVGRTMYVDAKANNTYGGFYGSTNQTAAATFIGLENTHTGTAYVELSANGPTYAFGAHGAHLYSTTGVGDFEIQGDVQTFLRFTDGGGADPRTEVAAGGKFRVYDSSDSDSVEFYHDGTDLVTSAVAGTTDWEINGFTGVNINLAALGSSVLRIGEPTTLRGSASDAYLRMYGEDAGNIYGMQMAVFSSNMSIQGVGSNPATNIQNYLNMTHMSNSYLRLQGSTGSYYIQTKVANDDSDVETTFAGITNWNIQTSGMTGDMNFIGSRGIKFTNGTGASAFRHDGTDLTWSFAATDAVNVTGVANFFNFYDGVGLRVFDSLDAKNVTIKETGSNTQITTSHNPIQISVGGTHVEILNGKQFRMRNTGNTNNFYFQNNSTSVDCNANTLTGPFTFTGWDEITGVASGVIPDIQYTKIDTTSRSLSDAAGVQTVFASNQDVFTLEANSTYYFRGYISGSKGSNSVSIDFGMPFTTAVEDDGEMVLTCWSSTAATPVRTTSIEKIRSNTVNTTVTGTFAATTNTRYYIEVEGMFTVTTGGTLRPEIAFSGATGSTPTISPCSYMLVQRLGTDTEDEKGGWA